MNLQNPSTVRLKDVPSVAEILGAPPSWIYGHIHAGTLPFPVVRVGRYVRFRKRDIQEYVGRQVEAQPQEATA